MSGDLKRSKDKWIAGVCGGIAKNVGINPIIVRLLWIAGTLFTGVVWGVIIYIVLLVIMKEE